MATILTNSTVYLGKNLFGSASSVTCPEIDMETVEMKNGIGTFNLPTAIKAMTASVTITGFDKDVFDKVSNPFSEINMTIYGSLDTYSNETLIKSEQAKLIIRASSQKFGLLGELKQQENIEQTLEFNVSAAKLIIGNVEKYHIDTINHILKIGGIDMLVKLRQNLALE
ncbi:MAG: phage major tail tube protein [Candidatus Gastranaerophilaceae bacterium]